MQVNYINPLTQQQLPSNNSYASIAWIGQAFLLWPNQTQQITISNQYFLATQMDLNPSIQVPLNPIPILTLPTVTLGSPGGGFSVTNQSQYSISVEGFDGSGIVNVASGQSFTFRITTNVVTTTEALCWEFLVLGSSTNVNTLSMNAGNSLAYINSTNKLQVRQTVTSIQSALDLVNNEYILTLANCVTYSATTLFNPPNINTQVSILLPGSAAAYASCGFFCTFMNEGTNPIVLQTQNDTINGVSLTVDGNASYVILPQSSVTLTSTNNNDWIITAISTQFQDVFKNSSLNLSTANYIGLSTASNPTNGVTASILNINDPGVRAVAIDMSKNLDLVYAPLMILNGEVPAYIQTLMASLGQTTYWILLPNNFNTIYFVFAQSTGNTLKFGLGCNFYGVQANTVVIPSTFFSWADYGNTVWAVQYSAAVTTATSATSEFFSSLLLVQSGGGGGGGDNFPSIQDINGTVSIIGSGGLVVSPGPARFGINTTIGGNPVSTKFTANRIGNLPIISSITGGFANLGDSGIEITVEQPDDASTNEEIPTSMAVYDFVSRFITDPLNFKGTWDPTTNTPLLANGTGLLGDTYISIGTGTVNFGAGPVDFLPGYFVTYNQDNEWEDIPTADSVQSVNGLTGAVSLYLQSLLGVTITDPQQGDVLTYDVTNFNLSQTLGAGSVPNGVVSFTIGSIDFFVVINTNSQNILIYSSLAGAAFSLVQTIIVGNPLSGISYFINPSNSLPTLAVGISTLNGVGFYTYSSGTFTNSQTITALDAAPNQLAYNSIGGVSYLFLALADSTVATILWTGASFAVGQTGLSSGTSNISITAWSTATFNYFATSNAISNNISIWQSPNGTFGASPSQVFDVAALGSNPQGITSFTNGNTNYLAVNLFGSNNLVFLTSSNDADYLLFQSIITGSGPIGISVLQDGSESYVGVTNQNDGTINLYVSKSNNQFELAEEFPVPVGTTPYALSLLLSSIDQYFIGVANSGSNNLTIYKATAEWVNSQSFGSLYNLSDVSIPFPPAHPNDGAVLTFDANLEAWTAKPVLLSTSDFNTVTNVGADFTVGFNNIFTLLIQTVVSSITFPLANNFAVGTTFCVSNNGASELILTGNTVTNTITMSGNSMPGYYKVETDGFYWYIDGQRQDLYSPVVTNSYLADGTLTANFAAAAIDESPIVSNATLNGGTLAASLASLLVGGNQTGGAGIVAQGNNANGNWIRFRNGLIIQWRNSLAVSPGVSSVTYPIPFVSAAPSVTMNTINLISPGFSSIQIPNLISFSFNIWGFSSGNFNNVAGSVCWTAIGY